MSHTAWHRFGDWYNDIVGKHGHYYHERIVIPGVLRLVAPRPGMRVLDLACGQGVLARALPPGVEYLGVDGSPKLIAAAKAQTRSRTARFVCADLSRPVSLERPDHDAAVIILALQNIESAETVIRNAAEHLRIGGELVIVLNHPCFRVPRQSSWGVDEENKLQYRRLNRYMTSMKVPMKVHPGKGEDSPVMWAFHHPLSFYVRTLAERGFSVVGMEEWVSDKTSHGGAAKRENRARKEFPLFLTLRCRKE